MRGLRGGLRDPSAFVKYTGTITRNKLANFAQRQDRKDRSLSLDEDSPEANRARDGAEPLANPGHAAPRSDVLMDLERALGDLPARCREVVESIYLHGYSYQETSDRLSISLSAVKRDQIAGLKALRDRLGIRS